MTETMDSDADEELIDIEERPNNDLEITISVTTEHSSDDTPSWADVDAEESHIDEPARFAYLSHLLSEVISFDGVLPQD